MKPTRKQLDDLKAMIAAARVGTELSNAEIGRISDVHPSQVGRICGGEFKTLSHNVTQVCKTLDVSVPRLEPKAGDIDPAWAQAQLSMRRLWDQTPEGALAIARILNSIVELQMTRGKKT